jgi:limonene-1,2-epoxide hydrolase
MATTSTNEVAIAEAFSHHDFARTYEHLAADIRWRNLGGDDYVGRDAVIAACDAATAYFAGISTTFLASRTIAGDGAVIVETAARYTGDQETSGVASCDVFDVADGVITRITSYNVEVDPDGGDP